MKKLLFIPAALIVMSVASCGLGGVKGNGHVVSKNFTESGFKDIEVSSSINVFVQQGSNYSIKIDAEENLLALMKVKAEGDLLVIGFKNNVNVSTTKDIKVYITSPEYRKLDGSGSCTFTSHGVITGNEVELDLSGASDARLNLEVKKLEIDASGASEIELKGKAIDFSVDGSGSTHVKAFDFLTENTHIQLSGAGDAEVNVSKSLSADISGAGDVKYKGKPSSINKEISGAGSVMSVQ
jgi:hypothetical protein